MNLKFRLQSLTVIFRFLLTIVFVALALKSVRWGEVKDALSQTSLPIAIMAVVVYGVLQCLSATRWWGISIASNIQLSWFDAVAAFFTGMFFNLFLPGLVGGDAIRALLSARKTNNSAASMFGIVYADRTVGFIAMLLIGICGAVALHLNHLQLVWLPFSAGIVLAFGVTAVLVVTTTLLSRWNKGRWGQRFNRFAHGLTAFMNRPKTALFIFLIAVIYHLSLTANLMVLGSSTGIQGQSFVAYAFVVSAATVIGSLPISIHGLGVRELASVKLWGLLQVPSEQAMLWALLWRVMVWCVSLFGGIIYLFWADKTVST